MKKKSNQHPDKPTEDDFKAHVGPVRPLRPTKQVELKPPKPRPKRLAHPPEPEIEKQTSSLSDPHADTDDISAETVLSFQRNPIPERQWRQFQRGKQPLSAWLDLHNKTIEQARSELHYFIENQHQTGQRRVGIIHGKGHRTATGAARLKSHVNHWLQQLPQVLAFCSAQPKDGGTGAVYVWLRGE